MRQFSQIVNMSYATVLAIVKKGTVPRKEDHRMSLRLALGLSERAWNQLIFRQHQH